MIFSGLLSLLLGLTHVPGERGGGGGAGLGDLPWKLAGAGEDPVPWFGPLVLGVSCGGKKRQSWFDVQLSIISSIFSQILLSSVCKRCT